MLKSVKALLMSLVFPSDICISNIIEEKYSERMSLQTCLEPKQANICLYMACAHTTTLPNTLRALLSPILTSFTYYTYLHVVFT